MLEVKNLSIKIGTKYIIKSLSFTLNKGDKLAIIGEEGNGKSTLLKSFLGKCEYAEIIGSINFKNNTVGYLEQSMKKEDQEKKGYDFLFKNEEDYYNKINNLYKYLEILKLTDTILEQYINTLSGGERVKIRILNILLEEYDILLLDEPTNDLDIETLEWLETFISQTSHPIIYISHDETLLSRTANIILHIEQVKKKKECRHTLIKITYDEYVNNRHRQIEKQTQIAKSEKKELEKKQQKLNQIRNKVEYQQNTISRSDPHGAKILKKKMHSLKSQEKRIENTERTERPDAEESIHFFFEEVDIPKSKIILNLDIKELMIKGRRLSKNIKLDIMGNEHICIIGKNGIGKTTLLKIIYESLKQRTDLKVGYMPQIYDEILNDADDVMTVLPSSTKDEQIKARMYLGNMKFTQDEMVGKIKNLSNGTKAKLCLIKLVMEKCNVLVLDEPTRNVSPLSNPVIREVLKKFKGTIISVSHDRKYIEEVIDTVYVLDENGLTKQI